MRYLLIIHYIDLIYPNGLSCSLPEDVQEKMYRTVAGLENVKVVRPAYGVEYDHVDARELGRTYACMLMQSPADSIFSATLETKRIKVALRSAVSSHDIGL